MRTPASYKWFWLLLWLLSGCQPALPVVDLPQELLDKIAYTSRIQAYDETQKLLGQLADIPGHEGEAAYGRALVEISLSLTSVANLIRVFQTASGFSSQSGQYGLTSALQNMFEPLRKETTHIDEVLRQTVADWPDDSIRLDRFVIYMDTLPVLQFKAEIDASDLVILRGGTRFLQAIADFFLSLETGVSILGVSEIINWWKGDPDCRFLIWAPLECYMRFGGWFLDRFPDALSLEKTNGKQNMQRIIPDLRLFFQLFLDFIDRAIAETDDQSDDLFWAAPPGSERDGQLSSKYIIGARNYNFPFDNLFSNSALFGDRLLVPLQQETTESRQLPMSAESINILGTAVTHLSGTGGRIDMQDFLRPWLEFLLPTMASSLFYNEGDASGAGSGNFADQIAGTGFNLTDLAVLALQEIVPTGMAEIDFYRGFTDPTSIRDLLVYYDYKLPGIDEPILAVEWECDYTKIVLLCGSGFNGATDGIRFAGFPYQITLDGIAESLPYGAFVNPDMGGLLWLNVARTPVTSVTYNLPKAPVGTNLADNYTLNYVIHRVWDYLNEAILKPLQGGG